MNHSLYKHSKKSLIFAQLGLAFMFYPSLGADNQAASIKAIGQALTNYTKLKPELNNHIQSLRSLEDGFRKANLGCHLDGCQEISRDCECILKALTDIQANLETCCTNLNLTAQSIIDGLSYLLCDQTTPISEPTTITLPGRYCLTANIAGLITINSDNVILDLNHHTITPASNSTSAITATNHDNIVIHNGIINVSSSLNNNPGTVNITGCSNVTLTDLSFLSLTTNARGTALNLSNINTLTVELSSFAGFYPAAGIALMQLDSCKNGLLQGLSFSSNTTNCGTTNSRGSLIRFQNGCDSCICNSVFANDSLTNPSVVSLANGFFDVMSILESSNIIFDNCTANNNKALAIRGFHVNSSGNIVFNNCSANNNSLNSVVANGFAEGFVSDNSTRVTFNNCNASRNNAINNLSTAIAAYGFSIKNGSSNNAIINCSANQNGNLLALVTGAGFLIDGTTSAVSKSYITNSTAQGNITGFNVLGTVTNTTLMSNISQTNGIGGLNNFEFVPVTNALIAPIFVYDISANTYTGVGGRTGGTVTSWDNISAVP